MAADPIPQGAIPEDVMEGKQNEEESEIIGSL